MQINRQVHVIDIKDHSRNVYGFQYTSYEGILF